MRNRNPMLWLLLAGALLFGAEAALRPSEREEIRVDAAVRDHLAGLWRARTGAAPTPAQLQSLQADWLREEILFREAKALELDAHDTIVRRRLVQKLGLLVADDAGSEVSQAELEAFHAAHVDRYRVPERFTFSQIYLRTPQQAETVRQQLTAGSDWRMLGAPSMIGQGQVERSPHQVDRDFGPEFAERLAGMAVGEWLGPLESVHGWHLVRIEARLPAGVLPLTAIEDRVRAEVAMDRRERAIEAFHDEARARYRIVVEADESS